MRIVFHGHSAFSLDTGKRLLIFDYQGKGLDAPEPEARAIAFVSHAHGDHFHPSVVEWMKEGRVRLVTGDDVAAGGVSLAPGEKTVIDGVTVEAYGSTDQGVSFLVQADGRSIFHAGDFNLWHWKHESTGDEIREAEEAFEAVLSTLRGKRMDVAFFPADPRMGEGYEQGAVRFMEEIAPEVLIPMHFWDRPEAAVYMKTKERAGGTRIAVMTAPGEKLDIG